MSNIVISVNKLSKQYRLGQVGTGTLAHDLNRIWHRFTKREDPYLKISETNERTAKGQSDYVWAIKDITFDVQKGEVLGIIGRNGAGKSTLLKILSRTTAPTTGSVKMKGRIASLLEVGTGFHPDLSGRENIFLNGAILGMTRREIALKFDEIVDFAGVERYIDTPVKRYSSGMYVRLAFAVAAHLEPEILIVDEVLAVGDAEFQKKCLGKIKDVSDKEGRTVLFVSHNMVAVKQLCSKGLILRNGTVFYQGGAHDAVNQYLGLNKRENIIGEIPFDIERYNTGEVYIKRLGLFNDESERTAVFHFKEAIRVEMIIDAKVTLRSVLIDLTVVSSDGTIIAHVMNNPEETNLEKGHNSYNIQISNNLQIGTYHLNAGIHYRSGTTIDYIESIYQFEVIKLSREDGKDYSYEFKHGYVLLNSTWQKTS